VSRPRIAVTLGDPRGIGPEIVRKALADPAVAAVGDFVVYGAPGSVSEGYELVPAGEWSAGDPPERAGRVAGEAIAAATRAALEGAVDAIVTAPIDKSALHAGGWKFPGHTEMLQQLSGAPTVGMLMAAERTALGGALRVLIATTHIPLRQVPAAFTADLLVTQSELASRSLQRWWGIARPRLALCAFNPHASDGGLFGDEEERIYRPAVERLRAAGILSSDPLPADTVFSRAIRGDFDAVIAPYHDVGMAAFKTACFGTGVNVTLGLPFPRTSPDHGTALDIAGRGIANPSSMVEAVLLAARLARAA
jgi:4-hydroxythreonine-4-phosphate dehydrogenase